MNTDSNKLELSNQVEWKYVINSTNTIFVSGA